MPQAANIVINDGAATPVAHTFSPIGRDDKGVMWFEQTTPAPVSPLGAKRIGYKQVRSLASPGNQNGTSSVTLTLAVPTLEVLGNSSTGITPPPTLAYVEKLRMTFDLPERGTAQERKDTRVLTMNLLSNSLVMSAIESLQVIY